MMTRRILSAAIMVPLLVGSIVFPEPRLFQLVVWLCIGVALYEFFSIMWGNNVPRLEKHFAVALGLGLSGWWILNPSAPKVISICVVTLVGFIFFCSRFRDAHSDLIPVHNKLGHLMLGMIYVAGLATHLAWLRGLKDGVFWVFVVLAATWLNDTFAYFAGRLFGSRKMAPTLSPGKTWEGWAGGVLGSAVGVYFFRWLIPNGLSIAEAMVLVGIASVFGPLGDLSESLLKRSVGVKDSGSIVPGHGGMLDRIDALLFTAPIFYYFAI